VAKSMTVAGLEPQFQHSLVRIYTVYMPLSGVPRFPIPRSANSDSPLKYRNLYGKQQLRCRSRAPLNGNSPLKGVYTVFRQVR